MKMKTDALLFKANDFLKLCELRELADAHQIPNERHDRITLRFPVTSPLRAKQLITRLQEIGRERGIQGTFSVTMTQEFIEAFPALPEATIQAMQQQVQAYCEQTGIKVIGTMVNSCGRAWIERKEIKIPKVKDVDTFCVCLHEIAHILNGRIRPTYLMEFQTEKKALTLALEWAEINPGLITADWLKALEKYEGRAKGYIMFHVGKGYQNGLRVHKIEPEVKQWLGHDFDSWPGNRIQVEHYSEKPFFKVRKTPARLR
jgi:hypothetical protein